MKLLEVNWKQKGYDRLPDPSPTVSFKMRKIDCKGEEKILIIENKVEKNIFELTFQ